MRLFASSNISNMDDLSLNKIRRTLNTEIARRLLIKYFKEKGFAESFDLKLYPPMIQDLADCIPEFANKVEIRPAAEDIDPESGYAKLRWDLFVLGNQRLFLGFTEHSDLKDIARQIGSGPIISEQRSSSYESTPKRIITFICRTLGTSSQGTLRHVKEKAIPHLRVPNVGATYFRRGSPNRG